CSDVSLYFKLHCLFCRDLSWGLTSHRQGAIRGSPSPRVKSIPDDGTNYFTTDDSDGLTTSSERINHVSKRYSSFVRSCRSRTFTLCPNSCEPRFYHYSVFFSGDYLFINDARFNHCI